EWPRVEEQTNAPRSPLILLGLFQRMLKINSPIAMQIVLCVKRRQPSSLISWALQCPAGLNGVDGLRCFSQPATCVLTLSGNFTPIWSLPRMMTPLFPMFVDMTFTWPVL
ncbi:hypothetical protein U1Q18_041596, partial [Sarracenia purpurea var. burkii]